MAWISVHDHIMGSKLRELSKEMGCSQEEALGILVSLWLWGLNNADRTGRLISADKEDVLEVFTVKLVKKLGSVDIVDCLIKTRWLDEPEPGILCIHDWDQWQEQWYRFQTQKEYDAKRKREERARKRLQNMEVQPEKQNEQLGLEALKVNVMQSEVAAPVASVRYSKEFEKFWDVYPRRIDKGNAYKKYMARLNDGYSAEELLFAAGKYAEQCLLERTETKYIKHPKTFLSDALPFLDYLEQSQPQTDKAEETDNMEIVNPFAKDKGGE